MRPMKALRWTTSVNRSWSGAPAAAVAECPWHTMKLKERRALAGSNWNGEVDKDDADDDDDHGEGGAGLDKRGGISELQQIVFTDTSSGVLIRGSSKLAIHKADGTDRRAKREDRRGATSFSNMYTSNDAGLGFLEGRTMMSDVRNPKSSKERCSFTESMHCDEGHTGQPR